MNTTVTELESKVLSIEASLILRALTLKDRVDLALDLMAYERAERRGLEQLVGVAVYFTGAHVLDVQPAGTTTWKV